MMTLYSARGVSKGLLMSQKSLPCTAGEPFAMYALYVDSIDCTSSSVSTPGRMASPLVANDSI